MSEDAALRRKLLKLDKNELARKCKKKSLAANGTKMDMVDRLIDYNEKNGGVSGAREGSKKNTNKTQDDGETEGGKRGGGRSGGSSKKRGGGGGGGGRSNNKRGGGGGGGGGAQCDCSGSGGNGQNAAVAQVVSIICVILYIIALAVDELSHGDFLGIDYYCGWKRTCTESNCIDDALEDACDWCKDWNLDTEACDDTCSSWSGGQSWLAFNIIGVILCFFGVLGMFSDQIQCACSGQLRSKAFILFICSAICAILAVIIFVATNDYFGGCYGDGTDYDLGASNILDICIGIALAIVAFLSY